MPHVPSWALHAGSLAKDLYSSESSRLPRLRSSKPGVMLSHTTAFDEDRPLPTPVNSDELPIPTTALMHGITDPKKVPGFTSREPSTPTPAVHCHGWRPDSTFSTAEITELRNLGSVGEAPLSQLSWEPSPSEWYERTSSHIIGMIVLMVIAIIIVEIYENYLSCGRSKTRSRSSRGRERGLRLEGSERQLYAEAVPLYIEVKLLPEDTKIDDDEDEDEETEDFWSV